MIIFNICSEANPYIKTGGLADVTYSLSKELAKSNDVSIILPLYNKIKEKGISYNKVAQVSTHMSWRQQNSSVFLEKRDGINFYFIENLQYFERDGIYGYPDDGERFAFFSLAAIELIKTLKITPDIIHVHDWQVGMIPLLIRKQNVNYFSKTKSVITIHNCAFLGYLDKMALGNLYNLSDLYFNNGSVKMNDRVSTLKAGIMYADKITAVSPSNKYEMLTPEGGNGLDGALNLREWDFAGFLNGIDYDEFNPKTDKYIKCNFDQENVFEGKGKNKAELAEKLGLKNKNAPMFGLVSRVTWQKGMSLVFAAIPELIKRGANVVLLGSGEQAYENQMNEFHNKYPKQVAVYVGYNNELAHQVYAACDFFLMPSLFEPCGLGQMIAERYGTLPIVRRTGGLKDSVINYDGTNAQTSNGFGFDEFSDYEMKRTCLYALDTMNDEKTFKQLVLNALNTDNSWEKSGKAYLGLYKDIIEN